MNGFIRLIATVTFVLLMIFAVGCGNDSKSSAPIPTPVGGGTGGNGSGGGSGSGGGTPSTAPDNFFAVMYQFAGRNNDDVGSVAVDATANNGAGTLQLNSGVANTTYQLQFCGWGSHFSGCTNVTTFTPTTNAQAENISFNMPTGAWSGFFQILDSTGASFAGDDIGQRSGLNFSAAMLPASSITGGTGMLTGPDNGSGSFVINGTSAQLKVTGAKSSQTYTLQSCSLDNTCTTLGSVTSDASGNINATFDASKWGLPGLFALSDTAGLEFVSGFRVQ